jgi:hypothetical protein
MNTTWTVYLWSAPRPLFLSSQVPKIVITSRKSSCYDLTVSISLFGLWFVIADFTCDQQKFYVWCSQRNQDVDLDNHLLSLQPMPKSWRSLVSVFKNADAANYLDGRRKCPWLRAEFL